MPAEPSAFYIWLGLQRHREDVVGLAANIAYQDQTFPRRSRRLYVFMNHYKDVPEHRRKFKVAHAEWRSNGNGANREGV